MSAFSGNELASTIQPLVTMSREQETQNVLLEEPLHHVPEDKASGVVVDDSSEPHTYTTHQNFKAHLVCHIIH
jgi:hypothetical protein